MIDPYRIIEEDDPAYAVDPLGIPLDGQEALEGLDVEGQRLSDGVLDGIAQEAETEVTQLLSRSGLL